MRVCEYIYRNTSDLNIFELLYLWFGYTYLIDFDVFWGEEMQMNQSTEIRLPRKYQFYEPNDDIINYFEFARNEMTIITLMKLSYNILYEQ